MSLNETIFKELIIKAQGGDSKTYNEFLTQISSFLKNYLRRRIFAQNEIEEVIQEILLAVHKSLHTFDSKKSFMGWFMSIVEYKVVDYIRVTEKVMLSKNMQDIPNISYYLNSDSDLKVDIEKAFSNLNLKEKNVLTLLKIEGQSVHVVAKQLEMTESNVKVTAHRAYINLRKYLGSAHEN